MATKLGTLAPTICSSSTSTSTSINNTKKSSFIPKTQITKTRIQNHPFKIQLFGKTPLIPVIQASSGNNSPEPSSSTNNTQNSAPTFQEDLIYLLKLAAGSFLGSALVKYGSAILPDITRPNLTQALLMISTPVIIAALLLFNGSRKES